MDESTISTEDSVQLTLNPVIGADDASRGIPSKNPCLTSVRGLCEMVRVISASLEFRKAEHHKQTKPRCNDEERWREPATKSYEPDFDFATAQSPLIHR
ncbi:unnamed protein product [Nippostrongylus brasiliensis]|uniref:Uncharacterized protein n=1 Tax=Nippostrongylus brasiliensis TaxID=27835 RepID=A0A0N4Y8R9_NIPBR|nr:unnamed protein product [Nippostrongylus brasiliensis]